MKIVLVLLIAYGIVCFGAWLLQARLIFFPERALTATPADLGLAYEDVILTTDDGVRLHGWFLSADTKESPEETWTVLYCHGNAGNLSHRLPTVRLFHDLGCNVFIFDYRGYGRSEGRLSERGTYRDAHAAWRFLTESRGLRAGSIVLFGRSLGGAVAAELAARVRPGGVILESTFTSMTEMAEQTYRWLPVRPLLRFRYPTINRVPAISAPVLVVHSRDDEVVPYAMGRRLYDAVQSSRSFLEIRGDHNDGFDLTGKEYEKGLGAFLRSLDTRDEAGMR